MMKTWLIRRSVLSPVSRDATAARSSSECKLPFIRTSPLPARTSSTAFAAEAWLWGVSTISYRPMSSRLSAATARILDAGPTRMGTIIPASAASTAPLSEVSSQGCATTVATGLIALAASIRRSYFTCRRVSSTTSACFIA
jgi:hypothetical protein